MPEVPTDRIKPLKDLAEEIRKKPQLAQEVDVSQLVAELSGRWRQLHDMLDASEEVPVAAWIVRRKVEGLVRPVVEEVAEAGFNPDLRAQWLDDAVSAMQICWQDAQRLKGRAAEPLPHKRPALVKDPSVWKILWSYPKLREKATPVVAEVPREGRPLAGIMQDLLVRLRQHHRIVLHEVMAGLPKEEWTQVFMAAVHLWHQDSVELNQSGPFAPLVLQQALREGDPK